jgi:hypothetical protein
MKCEKAQKLFSEWHNGELSARVESALEAHVESCVFCQQIAGAYDEMMTMLGAAEEQPLPADFDDAVHNRLVAANVAGPLKSSAATWWRPTLRGSALVAAGAVTVALLFWLRSDPGAAAPALCETPATSEHPSASDELAAHDIDLGAIAVVTLDITTTTAGEEIEFEIILPDGLVLVGEGFTPLREKVVTWTVSVAQAGDPIRIPVRAERLGDWVLVARARSGDAEVTSQTRLRVTPV